MKITDPRYVAGVENFVSGLIKAHEAGLIEQDLAARQIRAIFSQTNDRFGKYFVGLPDNVFSNPDLFVGIANRFNTELQKVQRSQNYFGNVVQGHHGISVSSMEAASRHLPTAQRLQFLEHFAETYGGAGTDEDTLFPLSNLGHQSTGKARGVKQDVYNAHVDSNPTTLADSFTPNQGTWQLEDFSNITDPQKLADEFWNRSGSPQIRLAEIAFDQPNEIKFRKNLAERLGIRERDLYTNPAKTKKLLNSLGVDKNQALQIMQESYGMTYVPPDSRPFTGERPQRPIRPPMTHPVLLENLRNIRNGSNSSSLGFVDGQIIDQTANFLKDNWKGGLANVALGNVDRQVGEQLGQGNINEAAASLSKNWLGGAVAEGAINQAVSRLPSAAAKVAAKAGTALGAATPILAALTTYDVADGVVKGATGRTITEHYVDRRKKIDAQRAAVPEQLFPKPKAVSAHTPTGVAKLTKPKPIPTIGHRIQNEIQYGVNTVTNALSRLNPFRKAN